MTCSLAAPNTHAMVWQENVWPIQLTTWPYYVAKMPLAGTVLDVPVEVLLGSDGTTVLGLAVYWDAVPSRFDLVR